jgi:DNA-binding MurR/RpiR family transcriptional regulator
MHQSRLEDVLASLQAKLPELTPQQRLAAQHILDNPHDVAVSSLRELAEAAAVTPNTLVRLAQALRFDGFESLREPFKDSARSGSRSPLERAEWLQTVAGGGAAGKLLGAVAGSIFRNLETLFEGVEAEQVERVARTLLKARNVYVFGVGTLLPVARLFVANARMAMSNVIAIPSDGSLPLDDLARAGGKDVLLAMTFEPYRREAIDVARQAHRQGVRIIGLTDSWKSPLIRFAAETFIVPAAAPHIFTSAIALAAFLELLLAYVIKDGGKELSANIKEFHRRRFELDMYWQE